MNRIRNGVSAVTIVAIALAGLVLGVSAQRVNTREVRDIVRSLNMKIDDFRDKLTYRLRTNSADRDEIDDVTQDLDELKRRVRGFENDLNIRRDNRDTVNDILDAAANINNYMRASRQNRELETGWADIRSQLDRLAANYGITRNWVTNAAADQDDDRRYQDPNASTSRLTGTFRLDPARSERIADVISGTRVSVTQRQELESKLEAPEEIALFVEGDQVTLASSKASPVTFTADGTEKTERSGNRTVRMRATINGDTLSVSSIGGETDYNIRFTTDDGGRTLRVTRRITTDYLRETIFAESVYTRTSTTAGLGIDAGGGDNTSGGYSSNDPNDRPSYDPQTQQYPGNRYPTRQRIGEFIVPNGTVVVGRLETTIDTKASQNNDRFRMIVDTPTEFRGAVIEGYLSGIDRSGRVLGKTVITFNFDKITMPDGREYDFGGTLQRLVDHTGKVIRVDNEGTARGTDKNRETAKRGGIGAGIGAIIGAIAGGGSGAAVGAVIGGGIGAGSVYAEGGGDLQLQRGTTLTVQSSSPIR